MDLILKVDSSEAQDLDELECLFHIVGNFALDGFDAREKLVEKILKSNFFDILLNQLSEKSKLSELGLWTVECLMQE